MSASHTKARAADLTLTLRTHLGILSLLEPILFCEAEVICVSQRYMAFWTVDVELDFIDSYKR